MTPQPTDAVFLPADNPFAAPSALPYGLPPFAQIREEHFLPAFEAGMALQRTEIEAIATDSAQPALGNTVEALERSGRLLTRVSAVFFNLTSAASTPGLRAIEATVAPLLSAHRDSIYLDKRLWHRLNTVYALRYEPGPDRTRLDAEQVRLVERYHLDFVRAGAALPPRDGPQQLRELNAELSALTTAFHAALLAETEDLAVRVASSGELDGLSADAVAAARTAAESRGLDGWLLTLALPSQQPALALLRDRSVRERLYRASTSRGGRGGDHDTRATLLRIAQLRAERAALLGYPTHADYVIADQTAGTLDAATSMLLGLVTPAVENALAEGRELEKRLLADGFSEPLEPWDWAYYAEVVRRERFCVDQAALRPYLELHATLREGVFRAAGALYGLRFERRLDLAGYTPDVEIYEVFDEQGAGRGLVLGDWFAREGKSGGAWMNSFVRQSRLLGDLPVVVVNTNVAPPPEGEPALLTPDLVRTLFHEFGHALHGLVSDVAYPRLSGTSVPRDFVEYPSQVNEMWAWWPEVLAGYAVHHVTGEPMPRALAEAIAAAESYGQGFATTELLAAALLDLAWHSRPSDAAPLTPDDVVPFEQEALAAHNLAVPQIPPRYRTTYFAHIFSGGYSAGYYSYLWSEVLDADTVDWFAERGGLVRESGERFMKELLSRGGSVDPMTAYAAVLGRPPRIEPLLERRGLLPV